jgi:ring-1,2-phenylacetyl-CoA epoxidase subunit PaaD
VKAFANLKTFSSQKILAHFAFKKFSDKRRLKNPLEILEMVPDPEIPVINIVELGIVREENYQ